MTSLRHVASLLALMFVALFAPSQALAAPDKIYSINASPLGTSPVQVTIKNESPNGNSTINSFIIKVPAGVSATLAGSSAPATVLPPDANGWIYVNGFDGLKAGNKTPKTLTIFLNATYGSGGGGCGSYTWSADVFAGNSFSGDAFELVAGVPPTNPTQTGDCKYSLTGLPASLPAGATSTVSATLKNESAAGSGTITSLALTAPAGLTVTSPNPVSVNLAPGASTSINVTVAATCGAAGGAWASSATGPGGTFTRTNALPSTTVTPKCSLAFVQSPQNVTTGQSFDVKVKALDGNGNAITGFTGPVTLSLTGPGTLTTGTPSAGGGIVTVPATITTGVVSTFTLTAQSTVGGANLSVTSQPFMVFQAQIRCEDGPEVSLPYQFGDPTAFGQRGKFNKDGLACLPVAYTFLNNLGASGPPGPNVRLIWDTTSQPNAAFSITVNWPAERVAGDGLPAKTTYVAWKFDAMGNPTNRQAGRACLSNALPQPYGLLTGFTPASGPSPAVIQINLTGPAPWPVNYPFPISIGDGSVVERLLVTGPAASSGYTVLRTQGGTSAADLSSVVGTSSVMSNPLPLDDVGVQMQMCVADEFWNSLPPGSPECSPNPSSLACVQFKSRVFDIGDGFINRDF